MLDFNIFANIIEFGIYMKVKQEKDTIATKEDLANLKAEIIKWMFIFWIGQLGALIAIIKLLA